MYSIAALAISPNYASDRTIFASIQATTAEGPSGVYRSTDGGSIWLPFDAGLADRSVQAFTMSANFANDATLFLGTRFSGVYRFAGTLSEPASSPLPAASISQSGLTADAGTRLQRISVPYPSLRLVVTASGAQDGQISYNVPGPVVFNYLLINNGNEALTNIIVTDSGEHDICGDDPDTEDINEAADDILVGVISGLGPGQERTLTATFLVRPEDVATPGTDITFTPRRFAGCATATSITVDVVQAQDDVTIQLVVWTSITLSNSEMTDLWIWSFAVSPFFANDQTVFAGSAFGGLFKSSNAGSANPTWRSVNSGLEPQWVSVRAIVLSPRYPTDRTLYVGTEQGIYKGVENLDGTVSWSPMSEGLVRLDTRSLAVSPDFLQDNVLYAGVAGDDIYRLRRGSGALSWVPQRRILNGLWVWTTALTADRVLLAGTWAGGPSRPGIIGRNVMSGAAGWEFPTLPGFPGGETTALTVSSGYCTGYVIFAGTWDRGLFKSIDAGRSWSVVPIPTSLPIRSIALSPNYAFDTTLYVAT